ncbi:MAG: complex I NDUFA9 subunit family protein [Thermoleophilia bacterium]|nr:complex I NDUFA9 subunit family protein [Thermoleophilia bacterium]
MKIFITGGTGFVGKHLARRLAADGHDLACLAVDPDGPDADLLRKLGAVIVPGDIGDADGLAAGAAGCDAFIHMVGIIFQPRGATFEQIHVQGTYNAMAAATVAGVKRYLHMSALSAGPDTGSEFYRTKWMAEEAVRGSGLDFTIFRPSMIHGPGGDFIEMLAQQIRWAPVVSVIGAGHNRVQPVAVADVAASYSRALRDDRTIGQTYDLGGPDQFTFNEMIDSMCRVMGKRRLKVHIPVSLARPAAWFFERVQKKPLLTTDQLKMLQIDNVCDITRMKEELGVDPVAFEEGLAFLRA